MPAPAPPGRRLILGGLADVERDLIRTRTAEGRSQAKARGQHMGRPPKLTPQQQAEARRRRAEGATLKDTGEKLQRRVGDDFEAECLTLAKNQCQRLTGVKIDAFSV